MGAVVAKKWARDIFTCVRAVAKWVVGEAGAGEVHETELKSQECARISLLVSSPIKTCDATPIQTAELAQSDTRVADSHVDGH